jgi:hypothetical protein
MAMEAKDVTTATATVSQQEGDFMIRFPSLRSDTDLADLRRLR